MVGPEDTFHLAALVHSLGRTRAAAALAEATSAAAALSQVAEPREDPERLAAVCRSRRITPLSAEDPRFPPSLRHIPDPPLILYALGDLDALERPAVALVGARRCTRLGGEVASDLAGELARCGLGIVSGLARGIDAAAHRAAARHGVTVAVLGSGIANPYPVGHRGLVELILRSGGLLLSEYSPFAPALRHHFPERNRLISGLSAAVVVVEAGERSGSLITARMALEQGREVLAVPGAVTSPVSRGCHRLLRDGAGLVESAADVLHALGLEERVTGAAEPAQVAPDDPRLARLLAAVAGTVTTLDEIAAVSGVPGHDAAAGLVELELAGFVRQVPGGYIRRPRSSQ